MGTRHSLTLPLAVTLTLAASACATETPESELGTVASRPAATTASPALPPGSSGTESDTGSIDWATADLTKIDWATIDMSTVDYRAIRDNPTIADLDADTTALIGSRMNRGSATLTIGDQVWEFSTFACVQGHDNTRSDTFSFTTNSFESFEGVRTQMQVTIEDRSGTGQVSGEETVHRVDFNDIDDFEDPAIDWSMSGDPDAVTIEGRTVTVEGLFNDDRTPATDENVPGTLEGTCSDDSLVGEG